MRIVNLIPECIVNYIKLNYLRMKYPSCIIKSPLISKSSKLGYKSGVLRYAQVHGASFLGDYSYVNANTILSNTLVGKYTSIGYNCIIGANKHPTDYISTSPITYAENNLFGVDSYYKEFSNPTIIGNDCWIGSNVVIMQGVKIGDGAIIGAGAVVTKDILPYSIVGGIPAKLIKMRFGAKEIDYLLQLKWWDMDREVLIKQKDMFLSKENWYSKMEEK